jgi:hypothetical protein
LCHAGPGQDIPVPGRDGDGPQIVALTPVPGFVVFDLPGAPESARGTRLAPDVSVAEVGEPRAAPFGPRRC